MCSKLIVCYISKNREIIFFTETLKQENYLSCVLQFLGIFHNYWGNYKIFRFHHFPEEINTRLEEKIPTGWTHKKSEKQL